MVHYLNLVATLQQLQEKWNQSNFLKELGAKNIIDRKELESEPKLLGKGTLGWSCRYSRRKYFV